MTKSPFARFDLATAGFLAIAGYATAAVHRAALSWDGSWYFFSSLQGRVPFIPHLRYGTYAVLWLIIGASKMIDDPSILGIFYGLLLALVPSGSLILSWYYLRDKKHAALRIWPVLGILLTPLPGQFCLMSEATLAAQLLWPVLAIIAVGIPGVGAGAWLTLLSAELFLLHPTAALIFGLAAMLGGWNAWTYPQTNRKMRLWTAAFAILAVGKLLSSVVFATEYERGQVSGSQLLGQFADSILGFPLLLLLAVYFFGFVCLESLGATRQRLGLRPRRAISVLILVAVSGTGCYWASNPVRWEGVLDYRRFVLPAALPLVAMAFWHCRRLACLPKTACLPALFTFSGVSAVFVVVIVTQSMAWGSLLETFTGALARRTPSQRFVTAQELPFTRQTALRHWTACPLSILLQGRQPATLFVLKLEDAQPQNVQVNAWEQIPLNDGWFILHQLRPDRPVAR